jgi:hypothetical protein
MPVLPIVPGWPVLAVAPTPSVAARLPLRDLPITIDRLDPGLLPISIPLATTDTDLEAHQGAGTIRQNVKNGCFDLAEVTGPGISPCLGIAPARRPRNLVAAGLAGVRVAVFWSGALPEGGTTWV